MPELNGVAKDSTLPYNENLLQRINGKPQKPEKPDEAERSVPCAKLTAEVTKYGERIATIKGILDTKKSGPSTRSPAASSQAQANRSEFQIALRQKQRIRDEMTAAIAQRAAMRVDIQAIRDKMRIIPQRELEQRLAALRMELSSSTLTEAEGARAAQQLQYHQEQQIALQQYYDLDAALKENELTRSEINGRLQERDGALNEIKARGEAEKADQDGVQALADMGGPNVPALNAEKQECWDIMVAMRATIAEIRAAYDVRWQAWNKLDRNYSAWQKWDRAQRAEEIEKERADKAQRDQEEEDERAVKDEEAEKERTSKDEAVQSRRAAKDAEAVKERNDRREKKEAAEASLKGEAYDSEIYTCDQTLAYLRKFVTAEAGPATEKTPDLEAPEGMLLHKKRNVEEFVDMVVAPKKKGNAPKGLPAQKAALAAAALNEEAAARRLAAQPAGPRFVRMSNNLETLRTFQDMGIDAPVFTADVPATMELVEAKKQEYMSLRRQARLAPAIRQATAPSARPASGERARPSSGERAPRARPPRVQEDDSAVVAEAAAAAMKAFAGM